MLHIGADLHKDQVTLVTKNHNGDTPLKKRISCKCINQLRSFFANINEPFDLAVEAVGFYHWFYDLTQPLAKRIYLANAAEVRYRSVSQPKTDFRDATRLADFLRDGLFERDHHLRCYVPSLPLRALRHMTRRRHRMVRQQSREKATFRKYIYQSNLKGPANITSDTAQRWLKGHHHRLSEYMVETLWEITEQMAILERQQTRIERTIRKHINQLDRWKQTAEILQSIPGIGDITAWTLIAEIEDFTRFDRVEELVNYVGLDPRVFQSDKSIRHGRVTKTGPRDARWVLQQAAWVAIRSDRRCKRIYDRIKSRAGRKKAAVAMARKLLVWAYYMIKHNKIYNRNYA
jgi:transposase